MSFSFLFFILTCVVGNYAFQATRRSNRKIFKQSLLVIVTARTGCNLNYTASVVHMDSRKRYIRFLSYTLNQFSRRTF